ncbi:hypothetical protein WJX74_005905 [Apatococcus lobatus]|uniref:30S ribosomal protein S16, chloroplastic n=1 Tax=Apatococcus lobatus TaxID=904363 RepID=A0AAW1S4X4_9CHLO
MAHLQGQCCCNSLSSRHSLAGTPLTALRQFRLTAPRQPLMVEARVHIRFQRRGRKRIPSFRLVAMNSRDRRDGRPLEELGWYNPLSKETNLNAPAIKKWLQQGAQPSQTVGDLLRKAMILGEADFKRAGKQNKLKPGFAGGARKARSAQDHAPVRVMLPEVDLGNPPQTPQTTAIQQQRPYPSPFQSVCPFDTSPQTVAAGRVGPPGLSLQLEGSCSTSLDKERSCQPVSAIPNLHSMKPTLVPKPEAIAGGFERVEVSMNSMTHLFIPAKVASYLLPSALELATDPGRWLLAGPNGLPIILFDGCGGQWPMTCQCSRSGIILQKGWEAYASRSGLALGDQLYLQRRGIIARPGCIYLDARRMRSPAILDSGMSTSEQLSEDTQPLRRPSAGKSSGIISAIGSCQSPGRASPPGAPEGTWSASAAAVAPRGRSQPTVTSPRKPLGQRTNQRAPPPPSHPHQRLSSKPLSRPRSAAARQLSLHGQATALAVSSPPGPSRLPFPEVKPQPVKLQEAGRTGSGGISDEGKNAEKPLHQIDPAINGLSPDLEAEEGELIGGPEGNSPSEQMQDSKTNMLRQESCNRSKHEVVEDASLVSGDVPAPHGTAMTSGSDPLISIERKITCPTYCNRLHVTQTMALQLLPRVSDAQMKGDMSGSRSTTSRTTGQQQYQALFKFKLSLTDEMGIQWPVQYEGFVSSGQRHYRLTAGWTALVKQKQISVGDSVVLERWTNDRTNLRLRVINGGGAPGKISAPRASSTPSLPRTSRGSRRTSKAPASRDVDMLDPSSCPSSEASRGTAPRTSNRIYRCPSRQLSRGSSVLEESENDGLRPSDMQAWAMGAPAPSLAERPTAPGRSRSSKTPFLKRSASIAGLPDESACLPGVSAQGPLRRGRKLMSLSMDLGSLDSSKRQNVEQAEAAAPQTPGDSIAIAVPRVSRRKRSMQPTRAAESAWKTGSDAAPSVVRSRSAPAAAFPTPPVRLAAPEGATPIPGWGAPAAASVPAKKPRSKICRTPRSAWSSPVHQPLSATTNPISHACTPCPAKSQSTADRVDDLTAGYNAADRTPTANEEGPHAPATPAQPNRPPLDPVLASRALATLNLINAVGNSAANGVNDISEILRQKFTGDAMAATAGQ